MKSGSVQNYKHERAKPMRNEGVVVAVIGHAVMDSIQYYRHLSKIPSL